LEWTVTPVSVVKQRIAATNRAMRLLARIFPPSPALWVHFEGRAKPARQTFFYTPTSELIKNPREPAASVSRPLSRIAQPTNSQ
jgi:hypothetical protein